MLVEKIGKQMAKAGGIGIAIQLPRARKRACRPTAKHARREPATAAQALLVAKAERGLLRASAPGDDDTDTATRRSP